MKILQISRLFTALAALLALTGGAHGSATPDQPAPAAPAKYTNKLINEASPYLLEHAHNPVNWYPWGPEALDKAKAENKLIFLSIGYSACHWCHVMEHQSFEDEHIAQIMNDNFVAIKVDREQRPDIDSQYMMAYQVMSGSGGWPLNIILTPDRKPFQGSTYLPATQFKQFITDVAEKYKKKPDDIRAQADRAAASFMKAAAITATGKLPASAVKEVVKELSQAYDSSHGGFGSGGVKFPEEPNLAFLLTVYHQSNDKHLLEIVTNTLDHMIDGGIYDQLGGGFHRYSTDDAWHVPHFEKMLYNQAQLVPILLDAYRITKKPSYKQAVVDTLAFVTREMRGASGGFFSSIDADSEGEEGKFYLWTPADVEAALGADATGFEARYNVTAKGDLAGKSVLRLASRKSDNSDVSDADVKPRQTLLAARDKRVRPHTDDKILASWNGLMIAAYAQAAQTLDEPKYKDMAIAAADFIDTKMTRDGQLLHSFHSDRADVPAQLADYAYVARGELALYDATQDKQWLEKAHKTADHMVAALWDKMGGGFFATVPQADLLTQLKAADDDALQAPNAVAVEVMVRLGVLTNDDAWHDRAVKTLEAFGPAAAKRPSAYATLLAQTVGTSWWPGDVK